MRDTTRQTRRYRTLATCYPTRDQAAIVANLFRNAGHGAVPIPDFKRPGVFRVRLYLTHGGK
jgi:hypothetical protein